MGWITNNVADIVFLAVIALFSIGLAGIVIIIGLNVAMGTVNLILKVLGGKG